MDRGPAVHRTIVIVDVEQFGDPRRTNRQQVEIRDGLYQAMRDAFGNAGIPWDSCYHEDRGDGIFILVPAEVPKSLLVESLPPALVAALQDHNSKHVGQQPIRLRMALNAGEVNYDEHGVTGKSINLAFRLLDAPQLKTALARSTGVLAVIVSSWFFEDVVWHSPVAQAYERVPVTVKETAETGWMCPPDRLQPVPVPEVQPPPALRTLPRDMAAFTGRARELVVRLAPRPVLLAGREDLLAVLDGRLSGGDHPWPRIVALCGMGGMGKTSVAVEYAHRHLAEVGIAWQFACEDPAVLAAGFGELAAQLGVRSVADTRDPVASVHGVLAAYPREWLLMFDNAADRASIETFLPPGGRGRVLITSQNQNWPSVQALDVPVLSPAVAAGFLVGRTGDPDQQAATELAGELDGLPLALEQAAAYTKASGGSLAAYLASFRRRRSAVLARGEPTGYPKTVATTWSLAFRQLEDSAVLAASLLRLLAFCAPEPLPLHLLLQSRPEHADGLGPQVAGELAPLLQDPLAANDAIVALRRYSLISTTSDGLVLVHRLVQAVTADQMPAELAGQWRRAAATLIEAAIPGDTDSPETWPVCAALLPHAQAALAGESAGFGRLANYLGQQGGYASAHELQERHLDSLECVLGAEHPDTLAARASLARWIGHAGHPAEARDRFTALLPVIEQVLGPEDMETLKTRAGLAGWTGHAGDAAEARGQFAALLPDLEQVFGTEHPETLAARASVARWTGQAGDAARARDQFAALLPDAERIFGPEHPETLKIRASVAGWTGEAYDPAAARDQFAALLPDVEQVFGTEHPETLAARASVARWTGQAGDAARARDQFAALLPDLKRLLGVEHPDTLAARANFANWTGHAGDAAGARDLFMALLPDVERVLGPEHPEALRARANIARWAGEAGDMAGSRVRFAALLPDVERVLGAEHPDTLAARAGLARWTGEAGDAVGARDQFAALLPVIERVLGSDNIETLRARAWVARWTGEAGDVAAARDQCAALRPVRERVLSADHPDTLQARASLARWTGEAGDMAGARDQFAALLPEVERVLGTTHPHALRARAWAAGWTGEAGDAAGSRDQFAALLPDVEQVLGPEHPDTLQARASLARWTGEAGDAAGARDQYAALLPDVERVLGPEHPETLRTHASVARWTGHGGHAARARDQ